ncbi:ATP-binding cassette sub-family A member 3 [Nymphon striatum]|nr:ATP-binding cassette sub-family A member 3 [Nymphon striatum]
MAHSFRNFRLLLWKNFILQRRNWKSSILELLIPLFIASILVLLRHTFKSVRYDETTVYTPYSIEKLPKNLTSPTARPWILAYSPNSSDIQTVMKRVSDSLNLNTEGNALECFKPTHITFDNNDGMYNQHIEPGAPKFLVDALGYDSEDNFIDTNIKLASKKDMRYIGLVAFDSLSNGTFNKDIIFKVRLNPTPFNYKHSQIGSSQKAALEKWDTKKQYPLFQLPEPRSKSSTWGGPPGYMSEGFLPIQHAVSMAIISHLSGNNDIPSVEMQRYPFPPYTHDPFLFAMQSFFALVIILSYIYSCVNISKNIVHEKERKLKESMKVMGLSNWLHWLAWFVKSFIMMFISTVILVILVHLILRNSSVFVLLLFFTIIIINVISFSFLLSVFFSKGSSISTASGLLFFVAYLPYVFVQSRYETLSLSEKLLLSLIGNTGISFGSQIIVMWEGSGTGVQFDNLSLPASPDDTLTLLHILIMLLLGSLLNFFFTWYIEAVRPGEYGLPQPFYFLFMIALIIISDIGTTLPYTVLVNFSLQPSYWCGKSANSVTDAENVDELAKPSQYIEDNPIGLKAGISIQCLTKVYPPNNTAVSDLSLKMYKGQITALLGHNGAGKTTTMAMLTGIYPPTRGTAFVNDFDIRTDIADIRKNLGFCPQHDILFDDLTVEEHLTFFCTLKGYKGLEVKMEIDHMLDMLNLEDKRKALTKTLSGGMKRKLSVGIALCADSMASIIVMLDEPTSGMDPSARRSTWDLLNQQKKNRTILLTTHYMEEADVLGDRIAILASGELQCCGSSMFLKKKYGAGYHMVLVKESTCNVDTIDKLVTQFVSNAEMESNMGAELSYILPHESSSKFQALFQEIEDNKEALGISGYGASITTMEEVFIKVGEKMDTGESTATHLTSNQIVDSSSLTLDLSDFGSTEVPATDFNSNNTNITNLFKIYKSQFPSSSDNEFVNIDAETGANFNKYLSNIGAKDISRFSLHWIIGATFGENKTDNVQVTAFFNNQPALQEASLGRDGYQVAQNIMFGVAFLSASFIVFLIKERTAQAKHLQVVSGVNLVTFWVTTFVWDFINYYIPCVIMLMMFFVFNNKEYTGAVVPLLVLLFIHGICILPFMYCLSFLFAVPATGYARTSLLMVIIGLASLISVSILEVPVIGELDLSKKLDWVFSLLPMYCLGRGTFKINQNHGYIQLCDQIFSYAEQKFHITSRKEVCDIAAMIHETIPCCPQTCKGPDSICVEYSDNYLAWESPGIGRYLIFLMLDFFLFVLILVGIEKHFFRRIKYFFCAKKSVKPSQDRNVFIPPDDDVEKEKERILKSPLCDLFQSDMLIFSDLTKNYGSLVAVDHLSLGIKKGECFGLLGMNGAGKTSTFKMITGGESVSEGDAYLNGFSIKKDISEVQQRLGYCPQFDALIDEFTGSETLTLFARLRGLPERSIGRVIQKLSEDLIFEKHLHKLTKNYSGGNKRKLSTAIALIGDSPIIFMDEPTAGVDPVARRLMWKTICDVKNSGRSVLLTSHSMEECEALCGRLVIMVNGECCCLGSPQHLKSKFSEGYTVLVKLEENDASQNQKNTSFTGKRTSSTVYMRSLSSAGDGGKNLVDKFQSFFMDMFPHAKLKSVHQLFIHYHIPLDPSVGWAKIFGAMEKAKDEYHIEDYTVGQTSLEQVFLQFAALQRSAED